MPFHLFSLWIWLSARRVLPVRAAYPSASLPAVGFVEVVIGVLLATATMVPSAARADERVGSAVFVRETLWDAGTDDARQLAFASPALAITRRGTVLAFCEARPATAEPTGRLQTPVGTQIVMRGSSDGGRTWTASRVIVEDEQHAFSDPCAVVDQATGNVWLVFCRDGRQVALTHSADDGANWSPAMPIAEQLADPEWQQLGISPGHGIQLADGRLIIPCWSDLTAKRGEITRSWMLVSDDHGQHWQRGGILHRSHNDLGQLVERADGSLLMIVRRTGGRPSQASAASYDRGMTWTAVKLDPQWRGPSRQLSLLRWTSHRRQDRDRLLLAAPNHDSGHAGMTVWTSADEGASWRNPRVVDDGNVGLSDLAVTLERQILLCYESQSAGPSSDRVAVARFNDAWLANRADEITEPIVFSRRLLTEPRTLCVHQLRLDLRDRRYELATAIGEDPDGDGPIEAKLTSPLTLSRRENFLAAVNTNPWDMIPRPQAGQRPRYVEGGSSDMLGWVQMGSHVYSPPTRGHWSFWLDAQGRASIGSIEQPAAAVCAVAGFGGLLRAGEILPEASDVRHPRTSLGVDRSGRWLVLMVVDGRQADYSEGVSERELADLMLRAGCWDALNLDGGGSSIMLMGQDAASLQIMNRPSDILGPRPVPVMIGVRRRQ